MATPKPLAVLDRIREPQGNELRLALRRAFARAYAPPPKMPLDLWADKYRVLSPEAAAQPGRWRTDSEPMARGPMRAATDPVVEKMTGMMAAQVLKTEFVLNLIGYYAHGEPGPMLTVYPTVEGAEMFSKERLAPMIRDTPVLRKVFTEEKSRATDSTIRQKSFTGGRLSMVGANAPAGLASRPIRFVLCDEVDRYPASAGGQGAKSEGDPIGLAEERTSTFPNRKIVLVSTPTIKGLSRIESSFQEGDQRRFYVPCPHCGVRQVIEWAGVKWDKGADGEHDPATARYECRKEAHDPITGELGCGKPGARRSASMRSRLPATCRISDGSLPSHSRATPAFTRRSCHRSASRSRRSSRNSLTPRARVERLKKWTNLSLAETWEEGGEKIDPDTLMGRGRTMGLTHSPPALA
jgi:phage terminase large subunit GpA-like protein